MKKARLASKSAALRLTWTILRGRSSMIVGIRMIGATAHECQIAAVGILAVKAIAAARVGSAARACSGLDARR